MLSQIAERILVMPDKPDGERDQVALAWTAAGGSVERLGRFWEPPALEVAAVRLYGNATFCMVLEQKLGLQLVSPADDLLVRLPAACLKRELAVMSLGEAQEGRFPCFVKPLIPKLFAAAVYANGPALWQACTGLGDDTGVIVSEVVAFTAEVRSFVLDGVVLDAALYEGEGDLVAAQAFLQEIARLPVLPRSCVLDAGHIPGRGWALVEANASWGAGLNGCRPDLVIPAIEAATRPGA